MFWLSAFVGSIFSSFPRSLSPVLTHTNARAQTLCCHVSRPKLLQTECVCVSKRCHARPSSRPTPIHLHDRTLLTPTHTHTQMRQTLITTITGSRTIRCAALAAVAAILPIRHFTTTFTEEVAPATGTTTTLTIRRRVALPAPERPVVAVEQEQVEVVEEEAPDHRIIIITRITTIIITIRRQRRRLRLLRRPRLPPGAAWSVPSCARLSENHRCLVYFLPFLPRCYFLIANTTS